MNKKSTKILIIIGSIISVLILSTITLYIIWKNKNKENMIEMFLKYLKDNVIITNINPNEPNNYKSEYLIIDNCKFYVDLTKDPNNKLIIMVIYNNNNNHFFADQIPDFFENYEININTSTATIKKK